MKAFNITVKVISALISVALMIFAIWSLVDILNPMPETYEGVGHHSGFSLIIPIAFAYYAVSLLVMAIVLSVKKSNLIKSIIFTTINIIPIPTIFAIIPITVLIVSIVEKKRLAKK